MKILVITGCSKIKNTYPCRAIDLYQGTLFLKLKKFAQNFHFDLMVISAKYGLVKDEIIEPYNQTIEDADIPELQKQAIPIFQKLLEQYDGIILICGNGYYSILEPVLPNLKVKRGMSDKGHPGPIGLLYFANKLNGLNQDQVYKIFSFKEDVFTPIELERITTKQIKLF